MVAGREDRTEWSIVVLAFLSGVAMAAATSRIAPVLALLRNDLGMSLTQGSWIISAGSLGPAAFSFAAGMWLARRRARNALILGCLLIAAGVFASGFAPDFILLVGARLAESMGDVLVGVAAPTLLVEATAIRHRASVLSIWGTYVPLGIALASFLGGLLGSTVGWRTWLWLPGAVPLAIALALTLVPHSAVTSPGPTDPASGAARRLLRALLLGGGFLAVVITSMTILTLLPTFLTQQFGASTETAGNITALVALASIPGSLLAGASFRYGIAPFRVALTGLVIPLAAWLAFTLDFAAAIAVVAVLVVANGALVATVFSAVPAVVANARDVGLANGLVAQLGTVGSIVGVPLMSFTVSHGGWSSARPIMTASVLCGLALIIPAIRRPSAA